MYTESLGGSGPKVSEAGTSVDLNPLGEISLPNLLDVEDSESVLESQLGTVPTKTWEASDRA